MRPRRVCAACECAPAPHGEFLCDQCSVDLDIFIVELLAGDEEPA